MGYQKTVKNQIKASGIGLRSGEKTCITLIPAPVDTGIVFRRVDQHKMAIVVACYDSIDTQNKANFVLAANGIKLFGAENLLSALAGLGIDNLYVDLTSSEIPVMDGGAALFVFLLQSAGIRMQNKMRRIMKISKPVIVEDAGAWASLSPFDGLKLTCSSDSEFPQFENNSELMEIDFSKSSYIREISRARNYYHLSEIHQLQHSNQLLGVNSDNSVLVENNRIINSGGVRYPNELTRYRVAVTLGMLSVLGNELRAQYRGHNADHRIMLKLLKTTMASLNCWELETDVEASLPLRQTAHGI